MGDIHPVCADPSKCPTLPVYCLTKDLNWLPGSMANRAKAVAAAWGGSLPTGRGICHEGGRRLSLGYVSGEAATARSWDAVTARDAVALLAVACGLAIWIVLTKKRAQKLEPSSVQGSEV